MENKKILDIKVIVTTSNAYKHLIPVFCFLFNRFWNDKQPVELVGYDHPYCKLPDNFTFVSLGNQSNTNKDFSNDLRKYFEKQDQYFCWLMEDTLIKSVNFETLKIAEFVATNIDSRIGRVSLGNFSVNQYTEFYGRISDYMIYMTPPKSEYRLSTQIAIWNKDFLLRYLTADLNPWEFECQEKVDDEFYNVCLEKHDAPVSHNEGVRKHDLFKYDLNGIPEEVLQEMRDLKII